MSGSAHKVIGIALLSMIAAGAAGCSSHSAASTGGGGAHIVAAKPTAAPSATGPASFTLPQTLDGLTLSTTSSAADLAAATKDDLVASAGDLGGDPVVGSYAGAGKDAAVLIGLPIPTDDANAQTDAVFDALRSMDLYNISDPAPVGAYGMQCANASVLGGADLKLGICVAADSRGSVVLLRFTKDAAAAGSVLGAVLPNFEK